MSFIEFMCSTDVTTFGRFSSCRRLNWAVSSLLAAPCCITFLMCWKLFTSMVLRPGTCRCPVPSGLILMSSFSPSLLSRSLEGWWLSMRRLCKWEYQGRSFLWEVWESRFFLYCLFGYVVWLSVLCCVSMMSYRPLSRCIICLIGCSSQWACRPHNQSKGVKHGIGKCCKRRHRQASLLSNPYVRTSQVRELKLCCSLYALNTSTPLFSLWSLTGSVFNSRGYWRRNSAT